MAATASTPPFKTAVLSITQVISPDSRSSTSLSSVTAEDAPFVDDDDDAYSTGEANDGTTPRPRWYSYFSTREFWAVLAVGQVCALCTTSANVFSTLIADGGINIPVFQSLFVYALITLIYTPILVFWDGPRKWLRTATSLSIRFPCRKHLTRKGSSSSFSSFLSFFSEYTISLGLTWRYIILSFLDVQGNYFTVKAYQNTNLLSAQLINFWSIVCVVAISFAVLRVRYAVFQIVGILVCCAGMGILLASDRMMSSDNDADAAVDLLKGDLFALLGATCYGISNVFEEWMASKRPMYEVLAFLGFFGVLINGTQAAIFDRDGVEPAHWDGQVFGYMVGYTLVLVLFYTLTPLVLRMGSAAFFDISLLTANFWGVIIGTRVFGLTVHFLYPVAVVFIVIGLAVYFLTGRSDSKKPWLGEDQEGGVDGIGTARRRALAETRRRTSDMANA